MQQHIESNVNPLNSTESGEHISSKVRRNCPKSSLFKETQCEIIQFREFLYPQGHASCPHRPVVVNLGVGTPPPKGLQDA